MPEKTLNFDATGMEGTRDFVRTYFEHCRDAQQYKHEEFKRVADICRNQIDTSNRDPNRANIFVPKAYSTIETIMPYYVDALLGVRPFIPIKLSNKDDVAIGDAMTDLLDSYLDSGKFFGHAVQMIKYAIAYGISYIESRPDYRTRMVKIPQPQVMTLPDGTQEVVGMDFVSEPRTFFELMFRTYAPWEIYKDPHAKSLSDCRGIIKFRANTSKRQLMKMAERGAFPDFDPERLDHEMALMHEDAWGQKIAQDMGVSLPKSDDDMGIWLSFESKDRYVDMWNFSSILRDVENPYEHKEINLTRIINTEDYNPETSYWGLGEVKPLEQLAHALNDNWNQTFNNHNMQNEGVIFYDEDALSVDQLVMIAGNRIAVTPQPGGRVEDAIHERITPPLSPDHYRIPAVIEQIMDQTSGVYDISRGENAGDDQTAREAILRQRAANSRMKLKIRMGENMGLSDFADKALSHIDQFAGPDDIVDRIGIERAMLLPTVNPRAYNGSMRYDFKGSDRMADAQIKRQDAKDIYQLTAGNPSIRQDWLADWLLQKFEVPEQERRQAVVPDEQAMIIQARQEMLKAQAGGAETSRLISNGRTVGGAGGNTVSGRDQNEKLSMV